MARHFGVSPQISKRNANGEVRKYSSDCFSGPVVYSVPATSKSSSSPWTKSWPSTWATCAPGCLSWAPACPIACIARVYPTKRECRLSSADEGPGYWQVKGLATGWFAPFSGWWHKESPSHWSLSPLSFLDLGQPWASSVSAGGKSLCPGFLSASKLRQDAVGTSASPTPHAAHKSAETNRLSVCLI